MKAFLRLLRSIPGIQVPVRFMLLRMIKSHARIRQWTHRWPVYGKVELKVAGHTLVMYSKGDDGIVDQLYYGHAYAESSDVRAFTYFAGYAGTIVDVGANTGLYTLIAAKANPKARLLSVEPNPANIDRLRMNIKLNAISHAEVLEYAVGSEAGFAPMTVRQDNGLTDVSSLQQGFSEAVAHAVKWKKIEVPVDTLNHLLEGRVEGALLIKCDVETYEMEVFKGAFEIIRAHRPVILLEIFPEPVRNRFFIGFLQEYHYYLAAITSDGIVYLPEGLGISSVSGLNFLLLPEQPQATFTAWADLDQQSYVRF